MLLNGSLEAGVLFRIFGGGGLKLPQALRMVKSNPLRTRLREACMADGFLCNEDRTNVASERSRKLIYAYLKKKLAR